MSLFMFGEKLLWRLSFCEEYSWSVWRGGGKNTRDQPLRWICRLKDIVEVLIWKLR